MAGAWYYLDSQSCVVKTTVTRIYGSQQWCPDAPSAIKTYNVHDWNRLFPGYYCPPLSHCGQPPNPQPGTPSTGSPSGGSVVGQGASGMTSGVAGPGSPGSVYTGPKPQAPAEGCAPAMATVDSELDFGRFSGSGKSGAGNGGFGFSDIDQMAQPLVMGMTPLTVQGDNGRPTYTQEPSLEIVDELGHQTVRTLHEGTADGILCFHPPELIDYMLHGSGVNTNGRWPTNVSQATVLLHNCSRADGSTGDISITRLAFGNPLKGSVFPKSGSYFQHTASSGVLQLVGTDTVGAAHKVAHLRVDMALDIPQYSDAEQALLTSHRAGTIVWNTTDEEYQYWDGSAWQAIGSGGSGDVTAASNITDNAIVRGDGGAKGVQTSGLFADDVAIGSLVVRTNNVTSANSDNLNIRTGTTTTSGDSGNLAIDVGSAAGTAGAINIGTGNTTSLTLGRAGINTAVGGTLSSGAHTNSTADGTMARALENDTTHGERTWHDEVSTTDATVTTALEFALPTDAVCGVKIVLVGTEAATDYDSHRVYTVTYRENTGLTLVDSQADYTYNPGPVPAATIDVNGANARVRVTGIAATTIRWHCKAVLDYRTETA